jgi:biopolymer transport protein ExbB/TolQ
MHGLAEFFEKGGLFLYVNLLVSGIAIAVIVERGIFLYRARANSRGLLEHLRKLVQANNVDRAIRLCATGTAPLLRVAKAGLARAHRGEEAISTALEEALVDATPDLKKRISSLWSLANIATLIGLLGTVTGLIRAFAAVAFAAPEQRSALLANGIAEAMNNTAMGLGIAVMCIIGHLVLGGESKRMVHELESFTMKLENFLIEHTRTAGVPAPQAPAAR